MGNKEIATASFLNANTIVNPDSIGDVANLVTCKLKLLFEIFRSLVFFYKHFEIMHAELLQEFT